MPTFPWPSAKLRIYRYQQVLALKLASSKTSLPIREFSLAKFNNLVRYWHKLHQQGQFARVHATLFPNEDQYHAESDGSSDINNSESDSDSNSSSKNSPEQPRRHLLSTSNSSQRIPKTRTPMSTWNHSPTRSQSLCYPDEEGSYKTIEVYRTCIKADGRPISVRYYKFLDGITCTNQFFNRVKDSVSSSLKLKWHFGVSNTEFSRSNQQVLPFDRYEMAVECSIVDIQVEASIDEDIKGCIEQWAILNFDDNDMGEAAKIARLAELSQCKREEAELARLAEHQIEEAELAKAQADKCQRGEAKAAEREIARHQKEHGCVDERQTAWVKEAKRRSEDAEFCRIQQEKKRNELDWDKLKSKGFELAEHSERDGKNKRSLKVKESQMKAQGNMMSEFQFDGRERVYPDYVPSTLAPQEHRIAPCKLQVNLFYDIYIDVYVHRHPADNCPMVFGKNGDKIICDVGQTLHFQGNSKEYEDYTVPNQDYHDHVSHLVSAICHQIPIAEYPPMSPPNYSPQLQSPVLRLHLQSLEGADFPANN
eukprot:jgi/Psemu1/53374/gm1.53374_g